MQIKRFPLHDAGTEAELVAWLGEDAPRLNMAPRPAVVVCPGGGYSMLSPREAEPVERRLFGEGFNVFEVRYSTKENATAYRPLIELSEAVTFIREHCEEFSVAPDRIIVLGFSAGAHLAGWLGTMWNHEILRPFLAGKEEGINRPNGMVLCYPVISGLRHPHRGSFVKLIGKDEPTDEELAAFSLEEWVDEGTCPAFLWHTFSDNAVPVENTLVFAAALREHNVPFEMHIFPEGKHGLSLATRETSTGDPKLEVGAASSWFALATRWIRELKQ